MAKQSKGYRGEEDCRSKWDNLSEDHEHPSRVTIASIFFEAEQNGWPGYVPSQEDYERIARAPRADEIDKFNAEFAFIKDPPSYLHIPTGKLLKKEQFLDLTANRYTMIEVCSGDGVKLKRQDTAPLWRKSKQRREHDRLVLEPDQAKVTSGNNWNLFKGFPIEPREGDVEPFINIVLRNTNGNEAEAAFLLDWMAHKIQKPHIKLMTCIFVMSYQNGVGKGLLVDKYAELFGDHYSPITSKQQKSEFNGFKATALLIHCDEATYAGKLELAEALKSEITSPWLIVNAKYQQEYRLRNLAELWLTSNRTDGVLIKDKDRRYAAFRAIEERISEEEAKAYAEWWDREGKNYVMHYLLHRDISEFNPYAPAPDTDLKRALIQDGRTELQQIVAQLAEECEDRPLRRLEDLLTEPTQDRGRKLRYLATELRTAGAVDKQPRVPVKDGGKTIYKKVRLWAVCNYAKWAKASEREWAEQWVRQKPPRSI